MTKHLHSECGYLNQSWIFLLFRGPTSITITGLCFRSSFAKSPAPSPMFSGTVATTSGCILKTSLRFLKSMRSRNKIPTNWIPCFPPDLMFSVGQKTGPFSPKTLQRSLVPWERHDWQATPTAPTGEGRRSCWMMCTLWEYLGIKHGSGKSMGGS